MIKRCVICNSSTGRKGIHSYFSDRKFSCEKCNSLLYIGTSRNLGWLLYVLTATLSFLTVYSYRMSNFTVGLASFVGVFVVVLIGYKISKISQIQ